MAKQVVLCLSGGLDSSVTAAIYRASHRIFPLFFDYGHPALEAELAAASRVAEFLGLEPLQVSKLPFWHHPRPVSTESVANYYYPYRNLAFATIASCFADHIGAREVWFGFIADAQRDAFPDATLEFANSLSEFQERTYQDKSPALIKAPVGTLSKVDLVTAAKSLSFPLESTYSCYGPPPQCGVCPSCRAVRQALSQSLAAAI